MTQNDKAQCRRCGHELERTEDGTLCCPQCGEAPEQERLLFGTEKAEGLTPRDYFDACLSP